MRFFLMAALWTCLAPGSYAQNPQPNPVPLINWLTPPSTPPGGPDVTIAVYGSGFVSNSIVLWNGLDRSTSYVGPDELKAAISSSDIATAGTALVTVLNPAAGGGLSNAASFSVTNPTQAVVLAGGSFLVGDLPDCGVVADFNGDGKLDVAIGNITTNTVAVLLGNGDGTFGPAQDFVVGSQVRSIAVGDFNGDGKLDLATANNVSGTVSILLGNGDGTFAPKIDTTVGTRPRSLVAADFNGDGILDLAVVNHDSRTVSILLGKGDGTFTTKVNIPTDIEPFWVVTADFNQDGKLDLAVADHIGGMVSIFLGTGDGTFGPEHNFAVGPWVTSLATGDFNGDGKADLAAVNEKNETLSILLGNGDGTFAPQTTYSTGSSAFAVGTADFNGDGKADIAVRDGGILLGNGDGTFAPRGPVVSGAGRKLFALAADFNGDGRLDVLDVDIDESTMYVFLQVPRVEGLPKSVNFQPRTVGTAIKPTKITMKNSGSALLEIDSVTISGDFSETNNCGSSLAAEENCTIEITFQPTATGTRTGAITVSSNASGSPEIISLTGTGE
jgi:FG-GAP-like repeat/Abnormal spindle-like microcephaly-assoc'd, ASPM-SPD-2-Hydin